VLKRLPEARYYVLSPEEKMTRGFWAFQDKENLTFGKYGSGGSSQLKKTHCQTMRNRLFSTGKFGMPGVKRSPQDQKKPIKTIKFGNF
jgi:hypothetical protein